MKTRKTKGEKKEQGRKERAREKRKTKGEKKE